MDKTAGILVTAAAIVGIIAGGTYIAKSYRIDCLDWFAGKTCAITQK